jgi:hypothetical protein
MQVNLAPAWYTTASGPKGKYRIRGLSGLEFIEMQSLSAPSSDAPATTINVKLEDGREVAVPYRALSREVVEFVLQCGVLGWKDLGKGAITGEPGEFAPERIAEICFDHVMELNGEIMDRSLVGPALEKNSSSQSKSRPTVKNSTALTAGKADIAAP